MKTRRWIGIDPGKQGAVAVLGEDDSIELYSLPVVVLKEKSTAKLKSGKNKGLRPTKPRTKRTVEYDLLGIYQLFQRLAADDGVTNRIILEDVHARPGNGIKQSFAYGYGKGLLEMALTAAGLPDFERVVPGQWRVAMVGRGTDKAASILRARKMFPKAGITQEGKWEGPSEALLMAAFLRIRDHGGAFSRKLVEPSVVKSVPGRRRPDAQDLQNMFDEMVAQSKPKAPQPVRRSSRPPLVDDWAERRAAWKARQQAKKG